MNSQTVTRVARAAGAMLVAVILLIGCQRGESPKSDENSPQQDLKTPPSQVTGEDSRAGANSTHQESTRPPSLVSFVFDDGYERQYLIAYKTLAKYHQPGNIAVIIDMVDQKGFATLPELLEMQSGGWEILSHTVSHRNLTTLSPDEVSRELKESRSRLEEWGFIAQGMIPPQGGLGSTNKEEARKSYLYVAVGGNQMNVLPIVDPLMLSRVELQYTTPLDVAKQWVDRCAKDGGWLIFALHNIGGSTQYDWETAKLDQLAQYVQAQSVQVITLSEGMKLCGAGRKCN